MVFGELVGVLIAFITIIITYYKWSFQYWRKKKLPYLEPSIPFGNISRAVLGRENMGATMKDIYHEMKKRNWKHGGFYMGFSPNYLALDLDLIKTIMTKDFQHFVDHTTYFNEEDDPLSAHLGNITGNKWKNLRAKLTPTFTSGKMKMMFQVLVDCEHNLHKKMEAQIASRETVDIKEVLSCYTTDIIGSCAFGLDCKSFEDDNSPFRVYANKNLDSFGVQLLKIVFALNFPALAKLLHLTLTPKDVTEFYTTVVKDTVEYREKNNVTRNDFMQILIDMKNKTDGEGEALTMNEIYAQSFVFFLAGFETSSTLMTFTLYELARHQDIQKKLRDEICTVLAKHDGLITYEAIQEMKYMDQVVNESLRKYPPAPVTNRKCVKDYKLPDTDAIIEKGISVLIPIWGIHYDEEYYPNPHIFDPERFSDENKKTRHHYTHLPFGEGPRSCIGMRFGLMQAKVGLTALLKNYNFTVNKKTKEPLKMKARSMILTTVGGVWLNAKKI